MSDTENEARLAATGAITQSPIHKEAEFYMGGEHEIRYNDLPDALREPVWRFAKERLGVKWQDMDTAERNAAVQSALDSVLIPAIKRRVGASVWDEAIGPKKLDFLSTQLSRPESQTEPEVPQGSAQKEFQARAQEEERAKAEEGKLKLEKRRLQLEELVRAKYKDLLEGEKNPVTREEAFRRLVELERTRLPRQTAETQPMPPVKSAEAVAERKLAILDKEQWLSWYGEVFNQDKFDLLTSQFVPALAKALREKPTQQEMDAIKGLYQDILLRMYGNLHPGRATEEYRENIQSWMNGRWDDVLTAAQRNPALG